MKQTTIDAIKFIGKTANESPNLSEVALILIRELCDELVKDAEEEIWIDH